MAVKFILRFLPLYSDENVDLFKSVSSLPLWVTPAWYHGGPTFRLQSLFRFSLLFTAGDTCFLTVRFSKIDACPFAVGVSLSVSRSCLFSLSREWR
jgi:hypothetical protein